MPIKSAACVCISVCLGILGGLLKVGFKPEDVAYIKPATQCESAQVMLLCIAKPENASRGANVFKAFRAHCSHIGMDLMDVHCWYFTAGDQVVRRQGHREPGPWTSHLLQGVHQGVPQRQRESRNTSFLGLVDVGGRIRYLVLVLRLYTQHRGLLVSTPQASSCARLVHVISGGHIAGPAG